MNVKIYESGSGSVPRDIVYLGVDGERPEEAEKINDILRSLTDKPYYLAAFEAENWNADFSPWKAPAVFGNEDFSGGGEATLRVLENEIIPETEKALFVKDRFIAGYSLAGLFALWAFYETGIFRGAASCSGSLWFPLWDEYIKTRSAPENGIVYLSLGSKEERVKNAVMSRVGERTRAMDRLLESDKNIIAHLYEENAGGHFTEPEKRTAKGIAWLLGKG